MFASLVRCLTICSVHLLESPGLLDQILLMTFTYGCYAVRILVESCALPPRYGGSTLLRRLVEKFQLRISNRIS